MEQATAKLRYSRSSAQKMRLIADLIRGRTVSDAVGILEYTGKRAAKRMLKLLQSAIANAEGKNVDDVSSMKIASVMVDGGPILYRRRHRARGRATPIRKRTSHVFLKLIEQERVNETRKKQQPKKKAAPVASGAVTAKAPKAAKPNKAD